LELDAEGYEEMLVLEKEEARLERVEERRFVREEKLEVEREKVDWVMGGGSD
jgi:hypothetical protein